MQGLSAYIYLYILLEHVKLNKSKMYVLMVLELNQPMATEVYGYVLDLNGISTLILENEVSRSLCE